MLLCVFLCHYKHFEIYSCLKGFNKEVVDQERPILKASLFDIFSGSNAAFANSYKQGLNSLFIFSIVLIIIFAIQMR